jgi:hypothetical protein
MEASPTTPLEVDGALASTEIDELERGEHEL